MILLSLLMAAGLHGAAVIATDAMLSIVIGIVAADGVRRWPARSRRKVIAFALLIGVIAFPGAFLARAFVKRHAAARAHRDPRRGGADRRRGDGVRRVREVKAHGHFTTGGIDDRIESTLPPVRSPKIVPRS